MRPLRFLLATSSLLLALSGCGDDDGPGPDLDAGQLDAGPQQSRLFGACEEDSQCPGEGAVCRHDEDGYPRGYCTVPCEDRTPCDVFGAYHHCVQRDGEDRTYCEHRCLNGADCRPGYTCSGQDSPLGGLCIAVCSTDEHCSAGYECDNFSGQCVPAGTAPTGAVTGGTCPNDAACRSGLCLEEVNDLGAPTGFVGGLCASNCVLPTGYNSSTFYGAGNTLPRGACPGETDVCFPSVSYTEGDLGICLPGCSTTSDCRPGYQCAKSFQTASGSASFQNGVCLRIDCAAVACPAGYECQQIPRSDGSTSNVCAPATAD